MTSAPSTALPAATARGLTKTYGSGAARVHALRSVHLGLARGAFTAIMGPSGSGKSTLMHCMAGLDTPSGGSVWIGDVELTGLSDRQLTLLRRDRIGFVFQSFNLLPTLTAEQNIILPLRIAGRAVDEALFARVVDAVGLRDRLEHRPAEMSGGEQQRVACARALVVGPDIVFADEPTGNLDSRASGVVLSFLRMSSREFGQTIAMVTHDPLAASYADRVVFLRDGDCAGELCAPTPEAIHDTLKRLEA